jgi:hypothetical protein
MQENGKYCVTLIPPWRDESFRQGGTGFVFCLFLIKDSKTRGFLAVTK